MSNYYEKRDAKVNIAHELMNRGWDVQGYSPDKSDSMTDYYCPAHWGGIATKNGYILVVDNRYAAESKPIEKYNPKGNLSFDDREKISKLEAMTQANGATAGEEENAKQLINKIKEKVSDQPAYEVIGMSLAHMANPKGSIWHIEKDGKIYDKGNALTKFSAVPENHIFDINTMQFTDHYKKVWVYNDELGQRVYEDRQLTEKERKVINEFKALILRFERVVNGMNSMGDGTAETEKTGLEQQRKAGYELKTVTKTKTGLKMVEVTDRKYIKVGDYIKTAHHCCYWKVTEEYMRKGTWKGVQEEKKAFIYEQVGKESRGFQSLKNAQRYYDYEFRMLKDIEEGKTKIYELKEVTETIETEKWVKINKTQKAYNNKPETKQEEKTTTEPKQKKEQPKQTEQKTEQPKTEQTEQEKPTVNINSESGNIELTFVNPPNLETKNNLRRHGFRLNYITKVWEIKNTIKNLEKLQLIFDITPEQAQTESTRSKTEETADNIIDKSTEIITELELTPEQYPTNEEYKTALKNYVDKHNIKITDEILDYIRKLELFDLAMVLEYFNIKDGFVYDCHFKEWDMSMEDIKKAITALNIPFIDWGEKIGFKGLTAEQTRQVKQISDNNNSMFFIDKEEKERKIYPAEININNKLNGIEINFIDEPDNETIIELKKQGFRYSQFNKIWYAVYNERNLQKACTITGNTIEQYKEAI